MAQQVLQEAVCASHELVTAACNAKNAADLEGGRRKLYRMMT